MSANQLPQQGLEVEWARVDPGAGGTLKIDGDRLVFNLVTAAAETRTLPRPKSAGTLVSVTLKTDGGDCTLLVTGGYDKNGNTSLLLTDAGDTVHLISTDNAGTINWRLLNDEGRVGSARDKSRYELYWLAGQRGKPGINADIQNLSEAVRMIADPDFELQGTGATSGSSAFNAEGGVTYTTGAVDGNEVIQAPHADANQSAWEQVTWGTDREVQWEARLRSGASVANAILWAGLKLTNTEVKATDDDQVYFRFEDDVNGGKWEAVDSVAGVDTSTDAGVTVAADTDYHLVIAIDASRVARFYLDGALVRTTGVLTDAVDLKPFIGVAADGAAAAKSAVVRSQAISRKIA